jgi:hypothetical protein
LFTCDKYGIQNANQKEDEGLEPTNGQDSISDTYFVSFFFKKQLTIFAFYF